MLSPRVHARKGACTMRAHARMSPTSRSVEVLVLGGSVSAGGGVDNDPTRAWHTLLGEGVQPTVHYKQAIDPSYFLHCAGRFVDREYDAALLDLGANMFGNGAAANLEALIRKLRCLHHISSVGVINWPGVIRSNATRVAASRAGATLIEVPHGPDLYSADRVHPNALGHARIAERARAHLAGPLDDWRAPERCDPPTAETCYPNATRMPVVRDVTGAPLGWRLVDESPTPERSHKYGWTSSTPGANLSLAVPQGEVCGAVVTLAYLASDRTGPFRITCESGCACTRIRTYHQWRVFPFPIVSGQEEWAGVCRNCSALKVTRETSFNLLRARAAPCRVTVTVLSTRRVRLDALYVQEPSEEYARFARDSPPSTAAQRLFGSRALDTACA